MIFRLKTFAYCVFLLVMYSENVYSQHWQSNYPKLSSSIFCLFSDTLTNKLYAGGAIPSLGLAPPYGLMVYDGISWDTIANAGISPIHTITRYNSKLILGGSLGIRKWDGFTFDTIGNGLNGGVYSLLVYNNELYAGGSFSGEHVRKWNGNTWMGLGLNNSGTIYCMTIYKGELYVGGDIVDSLGYHVCIANWNGLKWNWLGNGLRGSLANVNSMVVYKEELYVAGSFSKIEYSGNPGNYIAKWDGTNWSDVGGGVIGIGGGNGQIHDLIVYNDKLYAGGVFSYAGGVPAEYIAKWDGTNWCGMGCHFDNRILSLGIYQDMLYIGGGFRTIDGDSINYIAKWTGGSYVDTCGSISGIEKLQNDNNKVVIYPNPVNDKLNLEFYTESKEDVVILISNVLGQIVYNEKMKNCLGQTIKQISTEGFSKGFYIIKIKFNNNEVDNKFIKQ